MQEKITKEQVKQFISEVLRSDTDSFADSLAKLLGITADELREITDTIPLKASNK